MGKNGSYPYIDEFGNVHEEKDIYFTDVDLYEGFSKPSDWGITDEKQRFPNVFTKKIVPLDKRGFPTAVRSKMNGKIADIKVDENGRRLPIHAGSCEQINAIYFALPSTGKTTFYLTTLMSEKYLNALAYVNFSLSIVEDVSERNGAQLQYRRKLEEFEREKKLPGNTLKGQVIMFPYYVESKTKKILLCVKDTSGEDCLKFNWTAPEIINNKYFFVMISAEDILMDRYNYSEIISRLIQSLNLHRKDKDYEILVIITKSDLLYADPYFRKNEVENSIDYKNGKIEFATHAWGFNMKQFKAKEDIIKDYLDYKCPNLMNKLRTVKKVHFFMTASLGYSTSDNYYDQELCMPFSTDEPWIYILYKEGVYPGMTNISLKEKVMEAFERLVGYDVDEE